MEQQTFSDTIVLLTTCGTPHDAERIARHLIERRLAACVNILTGVNSIYRWNEGVETASECMLIVKTNTSLASAAQQAIEEIHPYELPECIGIPVASGSPRYLAWVDEVLQHGDGSPR